MIPKIVHYCWFGGNPLPKDAVKCIESWKKYLPDYEIRECNETNFDIHCCTYVKEAYEQKKYAFVSDYARFYLLYKYGGLYFDTDVEIIKKMDDIIKAGNFMAFEKGLGTSSLSQAHLLGVAPGLGLGAVPGNEILRELLSFYESKTHFEMSEGSVVDYTTGLLMKHGLQKQHKLQTVADFTIYPADYFCPMDSTTGIITITSHTVSIHHYSCSWMDHNTVSFRMHQLKNKLISIFGAKFVLKLSSFLKTLKS